MLARTAHELYWVGRALSRAEHTARLLDGVFHADLQGRATDAGSTRLSWEALLAIMGADSERASDRDDVISLLTLDPNDPKKLTARVPPGFTRIASNRSWVLYAHCG